MTDADFRHFLVNRDDDGQIRHRISSTSLTEQPPGEVVIRVQWSSLNYKDALAAEGHPGVAGDLPHVPGIDAAGVVASSEDARFTPGDEVLVTGYELGAPRWGGWTEYLRVPADWIVAKPANLSLRETMVLGTAGFTAAQCLIALQKNEVSPTDGPILVTGATGGVGSFAICLLSQAGYEVHAVSGKPDAGSRLQPLGAASVHARNEFEDNPQRPLLKARWAGGVDTVGGSTLTCLLKSTRIGGCVAACGLVAGDQLPLTVYPFILRGVALAGVTSASCPRATRERVWELLASEWKVAYPEDWVREVTLDEIASAIEQIKQGGVSGRVLIRMAA